MSQLNFTISIEVEMLEASLPALREFALSRALGAGLSENEFAADETFAASDESPRTPAEFYLGWAFDAGTPSGCGFEIIETRVEAV